jgi:hypothetical protein
VRCPGSLRVCICSVVKLVLQVFRPGTAFLGVMPAEPSRCRRPGPAT